MAEFSGLGVHLGNLSRSVEGEVALDQPGEFQRRRRPWRHGHRRHRRASRARPRPGLEDLASIRIKPGEVRVLADIKGPGAISRCG
jgi:hypothetical protein